MKITKQELKAMVNELVEEASKPNMGIDNSMLIAVIKDLTKIKENKIDVRASLATSQFDEFNKALNKIYSLLDSAK